MAKGTGSVGHQATARSRARTLFALVMAGLALGGCGTNEPTASHVARATSPASTPSSTTADSSASVTAPPVAPHDPDGVPDFGVATACPAATGDARAMRTRLRTIERGREPLPPDAASLLEGCGATARVIATSLEKGGRAIARAQAHEYAAAAAYFRRAIEIDPSYAPARLSLAGARNKLGQVDAAFYQLEQLRQPGRENRHSFFKAFYEGNLASIRLTPRFWTWAGDPAPEMATALPGSSEASLDSLGAALVFTPAPAIEPELIFTPFPIEGEHYRAIPAAVNAAAGLHLTRARSVSRSKMTSPWLDHLDTIGATLLTRPSAFRFGDGEIVVAIPFMFGETDMEQFVVVIAKGPESGPFDIVRVVASDSACSTPVAFTSRDRRVLGFFTSCDEGEDPTRFGRCIVYAENGVLTSRCGNGATGGSVAGGGYADDDYADDDSLDEEESYEDYGD